MKNSKTLTTNICKILKKVHLEYSFEELKEFERIYVKSKYFCKLKTGFSREDLGEMMDFYLGEFYIHHIGGQWAIDDLKGSLSFGRWIVNYDPFKSGFRSFIPQNVRLKMEYEKKYRVEASRFFKIKFKLDREELKKMKNE